MKKPPTIEATRRRALALAIIFAVTLVQGVSRAAFADDGGNSGSSGSGGGGGGGGSGGGGSGGSGSGDDDDDGGGGGGSSGGGNSGSGNAGSGNAGSGKGKQDNEDVQTAVQNGEAVPLRRLLSFVKATYGGSVINVELERKGKRYVYEVKLLTADNKLRVVKLDAKKLTSFEAVVY